MERGELPVGPWTAKGTRVYAADGEEIAVATKASPKWRGRAEDTAYMLSSSPDMYEALEFSTDDDIGNCNLWTREALEGRLRVIDHICRTTLAKARVKHDEARAGCCRHQR